VAAVAEWSSRENGARVPSCAWACLALATLAVVPVAVGVRAPLTAKRSLHLAAFDPLVWVSAIWLVLAWWRQGRLVRRVSAFVRQAGPALALLLVAGASALGADFDRPQAKGLFVKGLIQWAEYLVVGVLVFQALLQDPRWRGRALGVFTLAGALTVGSVLYTIFVRGEALPYGARGWLLNRNTYGMVLVLWAPIALAYALRGNRGAASVPGMVGQVAVLLGLAACWAGGPFLGVCVAGAVVLAGLVGRGGALVFLVLVTGLLLANPTQLDRLADSVQVYVTWRDPETSETERVHTMRYYRWSANLEMVVSNPTLGVGLEQYGNRLGAHYGAIQVPEGRTDRPAYYDVQTHEPLSFGGFFILAGELGLVGVAALLWLAADLVRRAVRRARVAACEGYAILGAIAGLGFAGWFADPMTRGVGGAVAFLLALAWSAGGPQATSLSPGSKE